MKPPIPWLRVFVEGVVIVGSILLALAADAWWDGRQEREDEREIVNRLIADVRADMQGIEEAFEILAEKEASLLRVESFLRGSTPAQDPVSLLGDVVRAANYGWNQYVPRSVTFDELLGSGSFDLIRDADIRERLSRYYRGKQAAGNRIDERETPYPSLTYHLVPRSTEFTVASGLSEAEAHELAAAVRGTLAVDLVRAEMNLARFVREVFGNWQEDAVELLDVLEHYRGVID